MQPIAIFLKKNSFSMLGFGSKSFPKSLNKGFPSRFTAKSSQPIKPTQLYFNAMGCNQAEDMAGSLLFISIRRNGFDGAIGPVLKFSHFYISQMCFTR
jgi:hypothetical protein